MTIPTAKVARVVLTEISLVITVLIYVSATLQEQKLQLFYADFFIVSPETKEKVA